MTDRDLAAYLADEYDDPPPIGDERRERWRIDGDDAASWALRKLAGYQAELDRLTSQAEGEQARIDEWLADSTAGLNEQVKFFVHQLNDWHARLVDEHGDQLPKTYRLVNGSLNRRKAPDRVVVTDADQLIGWAEANGQAELLTVKTTAGPGPIKARVGDDWSVPQMTVDKAGKPTRDEYGSEHPIVTADGEVVPGVSWVVGAEKYTVTEAMMEAMMDTPTKEQP